MSTVDRLRRLDRGSGELAAAGAVLPLLLLAQPLQPARALAAVAVILVLPGLAAVRALGLRDPMLVLAAVPAVSLASTVVVATALMYADVWSWQLTIVLLGAGTALAALAAPAAPAAPAGPAGPAGPESEVSP
jgi:hypothetical protein